MSEENNTNKQDDSNNSTTNDSGDNAQCDCEQKTEIKIIEENVDYKDAHARAVADYDNLKKETVRLRQEYAKYAAGEVIEQILPVFDNLNKALEQAPTEDLNDNWLNGIKLIREQFQKVLQSAGVVTLGEVGEQFDPVKHEALMKEKKDDINSDVVIQVIEPGYKMHDKILRPAKVIVAE